MSPFVRTVQTAHYSLEEIEALVSKAGHESEMEMCVEYGLAGEHLLLICCDTKSCVVLVQRELRGWPMRPTATVCVRPHGT